MLAKDNNQKFVVGRQTCKKGFSLFYPVRAGRNYAVTERLFISKIRIKIGVIGVPISVQLIDEKETWL